MRIFIFILAFLGLLYLGFIWILSGAPVPSIPPSKMAVPENFEEVEYQNLPMLSSVKELEVTNLKLYGYHFDNYYRPDDSLVWAQLFTENDTSIYVLIGKNGGVIDTLQSQRSLHVMDQYLVGGSSAFEMGQEGFSQEIPYQEVTGEITEARLGKFLAESRYYRKILWTDLARDTDDFKTRTSWHVMLHKGVWKRVKSDLPDVGGYKGGKFEKLKTQYSHEAHGRRGPPIFAPDKLTLDLTYFDQQEFFSRRPASFGSTTGVGREAHWRGTGFYTLKMGNKTLKFHIKNDIQYTQSPGNNGLIVQSHQDVDFAILLYNNQNNKGDAFIIRPEVTAIED